MHMWYLGGGVGHLEQFPPANNNDGAAHKYEAEVKDSLDTGGVGRSAGNQDNGEGDEGEDEEGEGEDGEGEDGEDKGNEDIDPGGSSDEDAGNAY